MQGLRRPIHLAAAAFSQTPDELSGVQETGSPTMVHFQLSKNSFDF
jgi:hypothetical protein